MSEGVKDRRYNSSVSFVSNFFLLTPGLNRVKEALFYYLKFTSNLVIRTCKITYSFFRQSLFDYLLFISSTAFILNTHFQKKATGFNGPLSALDWNSHDPALVGGCSIDSTVTLWDIEAQTRVATIHPDQYNQSLLKTKLRSQLIAHELPVHDIKFINATDMTTCSADGSIRSFDLRDLSNSQVLWDNPKNAELNHLAFNKMTQLHWAAIAAGSNDVS